MEKFDNVEDLEKYLLKYIDINSYKNCSEYISKWISYYKQMNCNVKILFLMKFKKISIKFHWIYIELSKFFERKNKKDISLFILKKALKTNVYDKKVLFDEIKKYPNIIPAEFSKAHNYLNPVGFFVLGKKWNEYKIKYNYDTNLFTHISFEEYRLKNVNNIIKQKIKKNVICKIFKYRFKYPLDEIIKNVPDTIKIIYLIRLYNFVKAFNIKNLHDIYFNEDLMLQYQIFEEGGFLMPDNLENDLFFCETIKLYVNDFNLADCLRKFKKNNLEKIILKSKIYFLEKKNKLF